MKCTLALVETIAFCTVCCSTITHGTEYAEKTKTIEEMARVLNDSKLPDFLKTAHERKWDVPHIHSVYWLEQMTTNKTEELKYETAKRSFGLRLAQKIDGMALESTTVTDSESRAELSRFAFDLSDWIGAAKGYGNFQIVYRLDNFGYAQIGYLVADLSISTNRIDALFKRAMTPDAHVSFRLAVLDDESPVPVDIRRSGTADEVYERLLRWWGQNLRRADDWCKEKRGTRVFNCAKHRAEMPKEIAFFTDEDGGGDPFTTVSLWGHKAHFTHCINSSLVWRQAVDRLYLFRQKVGAFPTEMPASWWERREMDARGELTDGHGNSVTVGTHNPVEAAFENAWEPFRKKYGGMGFTSENYELIMANAFFDDETLPVLGQTKDKAWNRRNEIMHRASELHVRGWNMRNAKAREDARRKAENKP